MKIIFIAQWLFGGSSEILHCSDASACRKKFCKPVFKQTGVNFLYCENMMSFLNYITATLRALFSNTAYVCTLCTCVVVLGRAGEEHLNDAQKLRGEKEKLECQMQVNFTVVFMGGL